MRPPISGPRPPFLSAGMPPRPMAAPARAPMNMAGAPGGPPPRPMPPPLRNTDSRGNLLMGPGPGGQRPPPPPLQNIQMRPPSGNGGPMSPPGQGQPRPPGTYIPWSAAAPGQQMPTGRPPNPYPGNPPTRPPFARPPGAPQMGAQQPSLRSPYQQHTQPQPQPKLLQQTQQQQQHKQQLYQQQQQLQQSPTQHQPPPHPPSAGSYNNEDDDDVVMGQAITPRKTPNLNEDPMGPALSEDRVGTLKDTFGMGETLAPIAEINMNGVKTLSSIQEMLSSGAENVKQQREGVHSKRMKYC